MSVDGIVIPFERGGARSRGRRARAELSDRVSLLREEGRRLQLMLETTAGEIERVTALLVGPRVSVSVRYWLTDDLAKGYRTDGTWLLNFASVSSARSSVEWLLSNSVARAAEVLVGGCVVGEDEDCGD